MLRVLSLRLAMSVAWLFLGAAMATPVRAQAQTSWPDRPIRLIVPFAPGGGTDVIARTIASKLSSRLGQPLVVENRAGGGGNLGIEAGVKAPPDGYTLLFITGAYATNAGAGKKLSYDPIKDISPIGKIGVTPLLVAVPNDSPAKSLRDLVESARGRPGTVNYGSGGVGSMSHLGMELLASEAKVQFIHIPYKGMAPAFTDLIAGNVQAGLATFATVSQLLESGRVRALAVTGTKRASFAPDLPTTAEAGFPGFQIEFWWGLVAPAKVSPAIVKKVNAELNSILAQPDMRELLAREAATPAAGTSEDFARLISLETEAWTRLIKDRKIKVE